MLATFIKDDVEEWPTFTSDLKHPEIAAWIVSSWIKESWTGDKGAADLVAQLIETTLSEEWERRPNFKTVFRHLQRASLDGIGVSMLETLGSPRSMRYSAGSPPQHALDGLGTMSVSTNPGGSTRALPSTGAALNLDLPHSAWNRI
eukprot:1106103-Amphidinium_carterae.1